MICLKFGKKNDLAKALKPLDLSALITCRHTALTADPLSRRMPSEGGRKMAEPRLVTVRRPGVEVGVTLCGGNLRGVYIESLDEDSPARGSDGLLPGDLILEVRTQTHVHTYNILPRGFRNAQKLQYTVQKVMIHVGLCVLSNCRDGSF